MLTKHRRRLSRSSQRLVERHLGGSVGQGQIRLAVKIGRPTRTFSPTSGRPAGTPFGSRATRTARRRWQQARHGSQNEDIALAVVINSASEILDFGERTSSTGRLTFSVFRRPGNPGRRAYRIARQVWSIHKHAHSIQRSVSPSRCSKWSAKRKTCRVAWNSATEPAFGHHTVRSFCHL
jgi:hypothetical protein